MMYVCNEDRACENADPFVVRHVRTTATPGVGTVIFLLKIS
jgi:hypothetical protein